MKKTLGILIASIALVSLNAFAHCGKCPGDKPVATKAAVCPMSGAGLNLTEEQKTKIAALKQECAKATSTSDCKAKCAAGMEKILDAEQFKAWKEAAAKCGDACPLMGKGASDKAEKKKECCPGH